LKTPLHHKLRKTKSLSQILKMIPEGSVVDSHMLFDGDIELSLAEYQRFVCARTTQYVVYEFWDCLLKDANRIYNIVDNEYFKFNEKVFEHLQENWAKEQGEYIRSALFFMLNRCSSTGDISFGELSLENYNRMALGNLKTFKSPENFHLIFDNCSFIESICSESDADYSIVNIGNFSHDLFIDGKSYGLEETKFRHSELKECVLSSNKKIALIYKNSESLKRFYSDTNLPTYHINKYGKIEQNFKNCTEVIIANF